MKEVIEGYQEFKDVEIKNYKELFQDLVEHGQKPKALFIGCSDSRVVPTLITNTLPGELFVIRNIGNFVAPFKPDSEFHATAAAIEYATDVLEVENVIVCGHSDCGAIGALFKDIKKSETNIHTIKWLSLGEPAKEYVLEHMPDGTLSDIRHYTEKVSVVLQLKNLLTYPSVKKRVEEKKLFLHGWHYNLASGKILYYSKKEGMFIPLEKAEDE
ncbi:MAG TPA: carbonic anhydrase [Nitratifractor sp.]|nr:carbonic anhydrase [Nitratifractor sp.]HHD75180.1 carbonic anhydrase [Nitratifractor sp.]